MKFLEKIRHYIRISGIAPIGRRYYEDEKHRLLSVVNA
jgi:DNA-binding transcriptional MerR regulator